MKKSNQHIVTLNTFARTSRAVLSEAKDMLVEAAYLQLKVLKALISGMYTIIVWIFCLTLIVCALPLVTYLRKRWQKQMDDDYKRKVNEYAKKAQSATRSRQIHFK